MFLIVIRSFPCFIPPLDDSSIEGIPIKNLDLNQVFVRKKENQYDLPLDDGVVDIFIEGYFFNGILMIKCVNNLFNLKR